MKFDIISRPLSSTAIGWQLRPGTIPAGIKIRLIAPGDSIGFENATRKPTGSTSLNGDQLEQALIAWRRFGKATVRQVWILGIVAPMHRHSSLVHFPFHTVWLRESTMRRPWSKEFRTRYATIFRKIIKFDTATDPNSCKYLYSFYQS